MSTPLSVQANLAYKSGEPSEPHTRQDRHNNEIDYNRTPLLYDQ